MPLPGPGGDVLDPSGSTQYASRIGFSAGRARGGAGLLARAPGAVACAAGVPPPHYVPVLDHGRTREQRAEPRAARAAAGRCPGCGERRRGGARRLGGAASGRGGAPAADGPPGGNRPARRVHPPPAGARRAARGAAGERGLRDPGRRAAAGSPRRPRARGGRAPPAPHRRGPGADGPRLEPGLSPAGPQAGRDSGPACSWPTTSPTRGSS